MSKLTKESLTELRAKGRTLKLCATINASGLHPMLIENVCSFIAKTPLIKVGMTEGKSADRRKQAESLASSTDSQIVEMTSTTLLLYRTPIFASSAAL